MYNKYIFFPNQNLSIGRGAVEIKVTDIKIEVIDDKNNYH